jgi:hypothetical protein
MGTFETLQKIWDQTVREQPPRTWQQRGNLDILQKLWEWAKEKLATDVINNKLLLCTDDWGRPALHLGAMGGRLERLQNLWEWANEKLKTEEININCY